MFTLFSIQTDGCGNLYSVSELGGVLAAHAIICPEDGDSKADYVALMQKTWPALEANGLAG